ncbi:MAG: hypothetical protein AAF539_15175 [Planctomycetota bacterium]
MGPLLARSMVPVRVLVRSMALEWVLARSKPAREQVRSKRVRAHSKPAPAHSNPSLQTIWRTNRRHIALPSTSRKGRSLVVHSNPFETDRSLRRLTPSTPATHS